MSEIPIKCFSASAVLLKYENDNAKVLLLRRNVGSIFGNEWCRIAGDIEKGETAWQAILREIKEEIGLQPEILYSANICEQYYRPDLECISVLPVFSPSTVRKESKSWLVLSRLCVVTPSTEAIVIFCVRTALRMKSCRNACRASFARSCTVE